MTSPATGPPVGAPLGARVGCDEPVDAAPTSEDPTDRHVVVYFAERQQAEALAAALPDLPVRTLQVRTRC
jgi:hypothetical protein